MFKVLLGGGIASGKSTVAAMLREMGAEVGNLDAIAVDVRNTPEVAAELASAFGSDILDEEGKPIPSMLAERAFATPETLETMNSICLPRIGERARAFMGCGSDGEPRDAVDGGSVQVKVLEVPLLDKATDLYGLADEILGVVAPLETRVSRAIARGMDEEDARRRAGSQAGDDAVRRVATTVIENDGSLEDLEAKLAGWWDSKVPSE